MRERTARGIWKRQEQRKRSRLGVASSLDMAWVFGRKGENNSGEGTEQGQQRSRSRGGRHTAGSRAMRRMSAVGREAHELEGVKGRGGGERSQDTNRVLVTPACTVAHW